MASMATVGCALVARPYVDVAVRLNDHRHIPATTVLAGLGLVALGLAGVGLRFRRLALVGLAAVSMGLALAWLGLTPHRFSGPVVANLTVQHGLHAADALAVAPTLAALVALAQAVRSDRPALASPAPRRERPIRR